MSSGTLGAEYTVPPQIAANHSMRDIKLDVHERKRQLMLYFSTDKLCRSRKNVTEFHRLEFMHIPKTAGTTIEYLGASAGFCWGIFSQHYSHSDDWIPRARSSMWHHAPRMGIPPEVDTFCVVRNPFDRVVSFYKEMARKRALKLDAYLPDKFQVHDCSAVALNTLVERAWTVAAAKRDISIGLFVPQAQYKCNSTLRFENIEQDFNELMRRKGMPLRWSTSTVHNKGYCGSITKRDLSEASTRIVRALYAADFAQFNYSLAHLED